MNVEVKCAECGRVFTYPVADPKHYTVGRMCPCGAHHWVKP